MEQVFEEIQGVKVIMEDIILSGSLQEEYDTCFFLFDSFRIIYFLLVFLLLILHNIHKDRILTRLARLLYYNNNYVYKIHGVLTGEKTVKTKTNIKIYVCLV